MKQENIESLTDKRYPNRWMQLIIGIVCMGLVANLQYVARIASTRANYTAAEMIKTPVFWLMYALFVAVAAGGLMATAQIGPIAKDYGIANIPVSLLGFTLPLLTMTPSIYTVKGTAAILVPLASLLVEHGNWDRVFIVGAVITIGAGILARTVLPPMRKRCIEESNGKFESEELRRTRQYA